MANSDFSKKIGTTLPGAVMIPFSFAPNGGSAITQSTIKGLVGAITSVTYSATGLYAVIFRNAFRDFICFSPSVQLTTDSDATLSSYSWVAATRTLTLRYRVAGAANALAADDGNRLGGVAFFKNCGLPY